MSGIKKVIDLSSNDSLEQKTNELKSSNSQENYQMETVLVELLKELKNIVKELKKINR